MPAAPRWAEVAVAATDWTRSLGAALASVGCAATVAPHSAHALGQPDTTTVQFKLLDYSETQPGADRVAVKAATVGVTTPIGDRWSVHANQTVDSISGASPLYHAQRLTSFNDFRRAWNLAGSHHGQNTQTTVGAVYSKEVDYESRALSLNISRASDDRNTTWTAGVGHSRDRIEPVFGGLVDSRRVDDVVLGWSRVLSPVDVVQVTLGHVMGRGYYSDPYKLVDERPRSRHTTRVLARWNHHVEPLQASLRMSARMLQDSWGLRAGTLSVEWAQSINPGWTVTPSLRLHAQTQARFYLPTVPGSTRAPFPPEDRVHYSADQRLAAFGAPTLGLRVDKQLSRQWAVDAKVEHYRQRSTWNWIGGQADAGLPVFNAVWWSLGLTWRL